MLHNLHLTLLFLRAKNGSLSGFKSQTLSNILMYSVFNQVRINTFNFTNEIINMIRLLNQMSHIVFLKVVWANLYIF